MRRRPQPSRRRGLLRAAAVVVLLTALLLAAILVVSSLLAPNANAPTPTLTVPTPPLTPARPSPTAVHRVAPTATPTHKKKLALAPPPLSEVRPNLAANLLAPRRAYFAGAGDAYHGVSLFVRDRATQRTLRVGEADPYVRPVWSHGFDALLYARVRSVHEYPGAHWSLLRWDATSGRSTVLASATAMQLVPLGWSGGRVQYLVATGSDTSIYLAGRPARDLGILMPQPVSSALLSPDGSSIAFTVPSSCTWCTVDIYDLTARSVWNGPSGIVGETHLAWTPDSSAVVTEQSGRLVAINRAGHDTSYFARPADLPSIWPAGLVASLRPAGILLIDGQSGRTFSGRAL